MAVHAVADDVGHAALPVDNTNAAADILHDIERDPVFDILRLVPDFRVKPRRRSRA
jgi:hypothetical protein